MMEQLTKEPKSPEISEKAAKPRKVSLPKGWKKLLAVGLAVLVVLGGARFLGGGQSAAAAASFQPEQAVRRDVTVAVSGTATLEPADSYQVTTLLSGTILSDTFAEDDHVEKDALLYTMDSGDARSAVDQAAISVQQAQLNYDQAREALHPTAPITGTLNQVFVHNGESVTPGTALAKIITSPDLTIDFLFTYVTPDQFYIGQSATVFINGLAGTVQGTVTAVSNDTTVTSNGKTSCSVRVKVANPGVVSDAFTASAVIGSYSSYGNAPVNMPASATVYASGSGTVSGFDKLAGSTVTQDEVLCTIDSDSSRTQLQNAKLGLDTARLSAQRARDSLEDYSITAPISGTVIEKNLKAGDKVDGVSSGTMAVIYDLSYLKMEMAVDELSIGSVQVGQSVEITASALPGQTFTGTVERVSINGTTTNGFTTYPVTIRLEDFGQLKPGMNVSARILCQTVENALCVPVDAVRRGNTVQVALPGALAEDGVTLADPAQVEERQVVLGASDEAYIQITSGLSDGETVLVERQNVAMGG